MGKTTEAVAIHREDLPVRCTLGQATKEHIVVRKATDQEQLEKISNLVVKQLLRNTIVLLDQVGDKSTCHSCGVAVWFVKHRNGRLGIYEADGISHFSRCPKAKHRKEGKNGRK